MTDAAASDYEYEMIDGLSEEHIAHAMAEFGVSREMIVEQWEATQKIAREGGVQAVMADLGKSLIQNYDEIVDEMAGSAQSFLDPTQPRLQSLGEYHHYAIGEISTGELDPEALMSSLVLATFKLAELEAQVIALQDGQHRHRK